MSGELDYSSQDKEDAKKITEWLLATDQPDARRVDLVLAEAPQFIKTAIVRLTFRHVDIKVKDLLETMKRVMDA